MKTNDPSTSHPTPRSTLRRKRERGRYDLSEIYSILDEALICHVAIAAEAGPLVLPTIHARIGGDLLLHGAASNHLLRAVANGAPTCVAATIVDGLVLARSAFHHSMNYRSVVIFGSGSPVEDKDEKLAAVMAIVEHVVLGRSNDARPPTASELRSTLVVRVPILEASAKVRSGPPVDDADDLGLPIWAGVLPVKTVVERGIAVVDAVAGVEAPRYVLDPTRGAHSR